MSIPSKGSQLFWSSRLDSQIFNRPKQRRINLPKQEQKRQEESRVGKRNGRKTSMWKSVLQ